MAPTTKCAGCCAGGTWPCVPPIIRSLQQGENGLVANGRMRYRIIGRIVYPLFRWGAPRSGRGFHVTEACNGCGICKNICPVANIELADGKPRWQDRCEQCYACFHWCPQTAVQRGNKTHRQPRYHHPDVTLKQMTARVAG